MSVKHVRNIGCVWVQGGVESRLASKDAEDGPCVKRDLIHDASFGSVPPFDGGYRETISMWIERERDYMRGTICIY